MPDHPIPDVKPGDIIAWPCSRCSAVGLTVAGELHSQVAEGTPSDHTIMGFMCRACADAVRRN